MRQSEEFQVVRGTQCFSHDRGSVSFAATSSRVEIEYFVHLGASLTQWYSEGFYVKFLLE